MRATKLLILPFLFFSIWSVAQPQLILLYKEKVIARFNQGDDFIYRPKKSDKYKKAYLTDIQDFYIVTFNDTVRFNTIDRVSLKGQKHRAGLISKLLITAGVTYFVLDQVNNVIVQGNSADLDPTVWKPSLIMVATGFLLKLIHKRSQQIRYPAKLMRVEEGSRFY